MDSSPFDALDRAAARLSELLVAGVDSDVVAHAAAGEPPEDATVKVKLESLLEPLVSTVIALVGAVDELRATLDS